MDTSCNKYHEIYMAFGFLQVSIIHLDNFFITVLLILLPKKINVHIKTEYICNLKNFILRQLIKLTSGTCKCIWLVIRSVLLGSISFIKFLATVKAILADSFITSPKCPVNSKVPSPNFPGSLSCWFRVVLLKAVSINNVDPP